MNNGRSPIRVLCLFVAFAAQSMFYGSMEPTQAVCSPTSKVSLYTLSLAQVRQGACSLVEVEQRVAIEMPFLEEAVAEYEVASPLYVASNILEKEASLFKVENASAAIASVSEPWEGVAELSCGMLPCWSTKGETLL